jgi:hypothetical protein
VTWLRITSSADQLSQAIGHELGHALQNLMILIVDFSRFKCGLWPCDPSFLDFLLKPAIMVARLLEAFYFFGQPFFFNFNFFDILLAMACFRVATGLMRL